MAELNTIDDFLSHRSSDASGGAYLRGWKKNKRVNTWLHRKKPIIAVWRHGGIPRMVTRTDKDTDEQIVEVWGGEWVCHEDETVLRKQWRRKPDGTREVAPRRCPLCLMNEYVYNAIEDSSGAIDWTTPLFKFEGDDPSKSVTIHAGGLLNLFSGELADDEKKQLRKAGINQREAWKENAMAKLNYLFCVVDHDNPDNGVQKAIEAGLLGEKVRDVIADARESLGREEGDPFVTPYAIQWEHRPDEKDFKNKYHARRMERLQLTKAIDALISGDPPDTSRDTQPFSPAKMRTFLEEHALVKLPWDEFFGHVADAQDEEDAPKAAAKAPPKASPKKAPPPPPSSTTAVDVDDEVACDDCGAVMKETDPKCKKCGKVYVVEEAAKPPPPAPRKRSDAKPAAKAAPLPPKSSVQLADDDDDGEIPF
jgi:hypothetical protein